MVRITIDYGIGRKTEEHSVGYSIARAVSRVLSATANYKHGSWIKFDSSYMCSCCNAEFESSEEIDFEFCPRCGAEMKAMVDAND